MQATHDQASIGDVVFHDQTANAFQRSALRFCAVFQGADQLAIQRFAIDGLGQRGTGAQVSEAGQDLMVDAGDQHDHRGVAAMTLLQQGMEPAIGDLCCGDPDQDQVRRATRTAELCRGQRGIIKLRQFGVPVLQAVA